jgi:hypothetical protein
MSTQYRMKIVILEYNQNGGFSISAFFINPQKYTQYCMTIQLLEIFSYVNSQSIMHKVRNSDT